MTNRFKGSVFAGLVSVIGAGVFNFVYAPKIPARDFLSWSRLWEPGPTTTQRLANTGVPVIQWFDSARHRLEKSIRIDVVDGSAQSAHDRVLISDVISYVNARVISGQPNYVVVTVAKGEIFGDVFRVVDQCRQTRATEIVVNSLPYEERDKY